MDRLVNERYGLPCGIDPHADIFAKYVHKYTDCTTRYSLKEYSLIFDGR